MNNYFFELSVQENLLECLRKETGRTDWVNKLNFDILKLPYNFFKDSNLFELITLFNASPRIFKMDPMTWYDWHTDETRQCAINMLIDGNDSRCFFGDRQNRDIVNLTELTYKPNTYYLFNTQVKHAVLNLNNTRYLLSIGFVLPNTYEDILTYCKNYLIHE